MCRNILATLVIVLFPAVVAAQQTTTQATAEQILSNARAAIGDEAKLRSLRSLSASGTLRRSVGEHQVESELRYDILLPDRFRRSDSRAPFTTITTIEGDGIHLRRVPVSSVLSGRSEELAVEESTNPLIQARRQTLRQADFARLLLGWVLMAPPSLPVEYNFIGVARGTNRTADVIEAKGRDGFTARLIIDQKTHQVLALAWRGKKLTEVVSLLGSSGDDIDDQGDQRPAQTTSAQAKPSQSGQQQKAFDEALAKAPEIRFRWVFSDFRIVDGLNLPHRMVRAENGVMKEEWIISQFRVNPALRSDLFEK